MSTKRTRYEMNDFLSIAGDLAKQAVDTPLDSRAKIGTPTQRLDAWRSRAIVLEQGLGVIQTVAKSARKITRRRRRIPLAKFGGING